MYNNHRRGRRFERAYTGSGLLVIIATTILYYISKFTTNAETIAFSEKISFQGVVLGVMVGTLNFQSWRWVVKRTLNVEKRDRAGNKVTMVMIIKIAFVLLILGSLSLLEKKMIGSFLLGFMAQLFTWILVLPLLVRTKARE